MLFYLQEFEFLHPLVTSHDLSILKNGSCGYVFQLIFSKWIGKYQSFMKIDLFGFSVFWDFEYLLMYLTITNNIKVHCYNVTVIIIYKRIVIFVNAIFNGFRVFNKFINILLWYNLFIVKRGSSKRGIKIISYYGNIKNFKIMWKIITHFFPSENVRKIDKVKKPYF